MTRVDKKKAILVAVIIFASTIAYFGFLRNTGLVTLPAQNNDSQQQNQEENLLEKIAQDTTKEPQDNKRKTFASTLSFEVIKFTVLEAKITSGKASTCPKTSTIEFKVKNTGHADAEKIFSDFQNLEVKNCDNCNASKIRKGESITITIEGCKTGTAFAQFYAVNTKKETVKIR